jgi:spore coat protein U-like protein
MHPPLHSTMALCLLGMGLLPAPSPAVTSIPTNATFAVNAPVQAGCMVVGNPVQTSGIPFGLLDFGTQSAVSGAVRTASLSASGGTMAQVQCTPGAAVSVAIDAGLHAVGAQRRLKTATNHYLPYALYVSSAMTTPYQPGVSVPIAVGSSAINLPVYGVATPPGAGLPAGQYTDTVQVVFSW